MYIYVYARLTPRFRTGAPLARYLYRVSYHVPAAGWAP